MLMPRRSKDQVIASILGTCQGDGVNKTKVVYHGYLNFQAANRYLELLIKNGLLEVASGKSPIYKTTQKGEEALKILKVLEAIYS
jgi:predicted transcriptional regulator